MCESFDFCQSASWGLAWPTHCSLKDGDRRCGRRLWNRVVILVIFVFIFVFFLLVCAAAIHRRLVLCVGGAQNFYNPHGTLLTHPPPTGICSVCLDQPATHALVPREGFSCGHRCLCADDARRLFEENGYQATQCPICRSPVQGSLRVHDP